MKWIVLIAIVLPAIVAAYGSFYEAIAAGMATVITLCIIETRKE